MMFLSYAFFFSVLLLSSLWYKCPGQKHHHVLDLGSWRGRQVCPVCHFNPCKNYPLYKQTKCYRALRLLTPTLASAPRDHISENSLSPSFLCVKPEPNNTYLIGSLWGSKRQHIHLTVCLWHLVSPLDKGGLHNHVIPPCLQGEFSKLKTDEIS